MKKLLTLSLVLFFCGAIQAQESLTFRVDANNISSISPNGIHVAGNWQSEANGGADWVPGANIMDDSDLDGIYELTVLVPVGTYEYKFINGNDWSENPENVPNECAVNGNREIVVGGGGVTADIVCFDACEACVEPGDSYDLTLLVDASQLGSINAAGLHVGGNFNGFSPAAMVDEGAGIYSITVSAAEGSTVLWKYINGPTFSDEVESVPGACGDDDGFGGFNRILTMPSADTTAGPVCFAQCVACDVAPEDYMLTLSVDASDLAEINPLGGIHVAGTFNGFTPDAMNDDGDGVYSFSVMVAEGSTVLYKFLNSPDFTAAEEVPEACGQDDGFGGFNRPLTMPSADTTAGLVCFSSCEACPSAPACELPYPEVDFNSLTATVLPNGNLQFEWEPIEGQIGCQINIIVGGGPQQTSVIVSGATASSFTAPANQLVPFTTYNYRVRCGCSQSPLIAGGYTAFAAAFYLPPAITGEMGEAYSDTPLSQLDGDAQWNNTDLNSNVVGDLFAMASSESWVRVSPNPAQDNVNLSYNTVEEGQGFIRVFDAQGKLALERVMTFNKGLNNVNLNMNELENGIYIVEVLKGESRESVRLLMQK